MNNEWFDVAWINFDKAILHGQYVDDGCERQIECTLTAEQIAKVQDMNAAHQQAMDALLRSFLP